MNPSTQASPSPGSGAPKAVLIAAAALVGATILMTAGAHLTGIGVQRSVIVRPVASLSLRFADRPDGSVVVTDARDGHLVYVVAPGTDGFVRGTMRGFVRERKLADIGAGPPFHLIRWSDGTLTLDDDATGRRIGLDAFGPSNAGAFAAFFSGGDKAR